MNLRREANLREALLVEEVKKKELAVYETIRKRNIPFTFSDDGRIL